MTGVLDGIGQIVIDDALQLRLVEIDLGPGAAAGKREAHSREGGDLIEEVDPGAEVLAEIDVLAGVVDLILFHQVAQVVVDGEDVLDRRLDLGEVAVLAVLHGVELDVGQNDRKRGVGLVDGVAQELFLRRQQILGKPFLRLQRGVLLLQPGRLVPDLVFKGEVELLQARLLADDGLHHLVGVPRHLPELPEVEVPAVKSPVAGRNPFEKIQEDVDVFFEHRVDDLGHPEDEPEEDERQGGDLQDDADQPALHLSILALQHRLVGGQVDPADDLVPPLERIGKEQRRFFHPVAFDASLHRLAGVVIQQGMAVDGVGGVEGVKLFVIEGDEPVGLLQGKHGSVPGQLFVAVIHVAQPNIFIEAFELVGGTDDLALLRLVVIRLGRFEGLLELLVLVMDQQKGEKDRKYQDEEDGEAVELVEAEVVKMAIKPVVPSVVCRSHSLPKLELQSVIIA